MLCQQRVGVMDVLGRVPRVGREAAELNHGRQQSPPPSSSASASATARLPSFPLAQQMVLCIESPSPTHPDNVISALFDAEQGSTAASYSRLHSLHLFWLPSDQWPSLLRRPFFAPLLALPSLRVLKLCHTTDEDMYGDHFLDWAAFRFLIGLPLTHLDLFGITLLHIPDVVDVRAEEVTSTWKVLRLPRFYEKGAQCAEVLKRLLAHYTNDGGGGREGAWGSKDESTDERGMLAYIALHDPTATDELLSVSRLSTLRSLEIRTKQALIDLSPLLLTPSTVSSPSSPPSSFVSSSSSLASSSRPAPPLPQLRHLAVTNGGLVPFVEYAEPDIITAVQQWVNLVSSHSATLICLELDGILVLPSSHPILQAVFSCRQLRRCRLQTDQHALLCQLRRQRGSDADEIHQQASLLSLPALPHLHTLNLALPLTAEELTSILSACPALVDVSVNASLSARNLRTLPCVQLVGRWCKRVRQLCIHSRHPLYETGQVADVSATAPIMSSASPSSTSSTSSTASNATPPFSQLSHLSFSSKHLWTSSSLRSLVDLLHAAPLSSLALAVDSFANIRLLSALSQLRRLRVPDPSLYTDLELSSPSLQRSEGQMPTPLYRYFVAPHRIKERTRAVDSPHAHQCSSADELKCAVVGRLISDEDVAGEWEWEHGSPSFEHSM